MSEETACTHCWHDAGVHSLASGRTMESCCHCGEIQFSATPTEGKDHPLAGYYAYDPAAGDGEFVKWIPAALATEAVIA